MDRDELKHWLDEGLSLPEIGILVNRDPSTVGYWVQKYGLVANGRGTHAPRGGLTREQLQPLVESGATLAEMAAELERSPNTVRYWLKKLGMQTQNRRGPRPGRVQGPLELTMRCAHHGLITFFLSRSDGIYRCKRCRAEAVTRRRRKVKAILVEEAGGRCALCGYDRCVAALQFHHVDPSTKSFGLSRKGVTRGLDVLREEAAKCTLLCANCHAEVEGGFAALT
jgi:hypothetical protein